MYDPPSSWYLAEETIDPTQKQNSGKYRLPVWSSPANAWNLISVILKSSEDFKIAIVEAEASWVSVLWST